MARKTTWWKLKPGSNTQMETSDFQMWKSSSKCLNPRLNKYSSLLLLIPVATSQSLNSLMKAWNSINELILKAAECKGKKDYLMKVEARIHYSDGNVRFANVENLRWYMHRSDAIGRFMNTTYGQSQDKTNVKVWTNRDVLYSLLAEHTVGPKLFSKSHFDFKIR